MADNVEADPGVGGSTFPTDELTYSGDTVQMPVNRFVHVTGAEGSKVYHEVWFAEDAAHTTGDYGLQFLAVRNDTPGSLVGTDLDYSPLQLDATGNLRTTVSGTVTVSATALDIRALTNADVVTAELSATDNAVLDSIDANTSGLNNTIGTDGAAGPANAISVGGTEVGGNFQEILVDTDGHLQVDVLSGGGGGTQYAVDDALGATPMGTLAIGIRDDALSALTPVEGDAVGLRVDANGALWTTVSSLVPGTGATDLGKAEDGVHNSGDTGIAILGVRQDDALVGPLSDTDGDYETLKVVANRLQVSPNLVKLVDNFSDHTSWAALNDDAGNVADETTKYLAAGSAVSFDKLNGTANTVFAIIEKTLGASINFLNGITGAAFWQVVIYIPDLTNVVNVVLRVGTSSANYGEWKIPTANVTAGQFNSFRIPITNMSSSIGTGWSGSAVNWVGVGLEFDLETRTLAGIVADAVLYNGGNIVEADITSETSVSTANVNVQKVGNQTVNTQSGNVANGTQRFTIATDDVNLAAINTATTSIETNTDFGAIVGGGAEASALRVTIANDSTGVVSVDDNGGSITVDAASLPLPSGAATEATLALVETNTDFGTVTGGGTEAGALRVTIASNTTGVLSIDDNGGSITVDGTVTANAGTDLNTSALVLDATVSAIIGTDGAAGPANTLSIGGTESGGNIQEVRVDGDGHLQVDVLSGGGGGTQYAVDDALGATPTGTLAVAIRDDTLSPLGPVQGDAVGLRVNGNGALWVQTNTNVLADADIVAIDGNAVDSGQGVAGIGTLRVTIATNDTVTVDATALDIRALVNTDVVTAELSATDNAVLDSIDTNTTGLNNTVGTDGAAGPASALSVGGTESGGNFQEVRVDADGHLQVDVLSGGGSGPTDVDDDAVASGQSPALNIAMAYLYDGTDWSRAASGTGVRTLQTQRVTIATDDIVPASQSGTWNITNVSGTVSLPTGAATEATLATVETNTDFGAVTGGGTEASALRVTIANNSTGVLTVDNAGTFATQVDGDALTALQLIDNSVVAHDAAVTGSTGVSVAGFEARSTEPTAVANADATRAIASLLGKQVNLPYAIPPSTWSYATATLGVTDTADDVARAAAGAGIRNYITSVQVINGHATVGTEVVIKDGATVLWRGWAEPTGGGVSAKFEPPLRGTANTAVNVANITTGSKTYFNLQGFEAAE